MPNSITVGVTGATPAYIFLCDTGATPTCVYITSGNTFPYTFDVPAPINNFTSYLVKIIDSNGCEVTQIVSI